MRTLAGRWWIIVLCMVVVTGAAVAIDASKVKQYEGVATLLFGSTSSNITGALNSNASNVSADPQRDQATTLSLVTSSEVARRVKAALRLPDSVDSISGQVSADAQPDANLIDVTALDPSPVRAARLANAFADQYKLFRQQSDRAGLAQGIQNLRTQLAALPPTATTERASIRDALSQLQVLQAGSTGGVQVVDRATPPSAAALPRTKRDAVLGALLGLALGVVIVFALDLFDRRLKTIADLEHAYHLPAMTAIPYRRRSPRNVGDRAAALEPYRILRSGISLLDPGGSVRVILITSAIPGEGKSTTAAGLARALAFSGSSVALVEADLRRPTFQDRFDLGDNRGGLAQALLGQVRVEDVLHRPIEDLPTLEILPSGGVPSRSAELLGGEQMSAVLDDLRGRVETIVLDAPPLLPVADTQALLDVPEIDVCLIVGRLGMTTRDHARRAHAILERHRVRHVGLVANGLRSTDISDDYSYYSASPTVDTDGHVARRARASRARPEGGRASALAQGERAGDCGSGHRRARCRPPACPSSAASRRRDDRAGARSPRNESRRAARTPRDGRLWAACGRSRGPAYG